MSLPTKVYRNPAAPVGVRTVCGSFLVRKNIPAQTLWPQKAEGDVRLFTDRRAVPACLNARTTFPV